MSAREHLAWAVRHGLAVPASEVEAIVEECLAERPAHAGDYTIADVAMMFPHPSGRPRSYGTVRTWCVAGQLEGAYKLHGREWRIPPTAVQKMIERQRSDEPKIAGPVKPVDMTAWRQAIRRKRSA